MNEKGKSDKIKLLRTILTKQNLYSMYEDEELWSNFSTWHLTYVPQGTGNRYVTLEAFVNAYPQIFRPMTGEEQELFQEWKAHYEKVLGFRSFLEADAHRVQWNDFCDPNFDTTKQMLRRRLEDTRHDGMNIELYRNYFTITELIQMGVPTDLFTCSCHRPLLCYLHRLAYWLDLAGMNPIQP
jgi:hypothetical protein